MNNLLLSSFVSRGSSTGGELAPAAVALPPRPAHSAVAGHRRQTLTPWLVAPLLLLVAATGVSAQEGGDEEAPISEEEVVVLSPFEVSSSEDRGYSRNTKQPVSIAQPGFSGGGGGAAPQVPITLIRRADAVIIEFALSNSADKQDQRNKELTDSVDALAAKIKETPGLRFENREVQLMSGNRSRSLIGKGGVVTSFANFAVFAELGDEVRLYERVKQVRALVSAAKLVGGTKVIDGPVALYLKRPNDLRKELLAKIFDDLETVKMGLGENMEVLVTGLNGPIRLRSCSEREVELWIDYGFTFRSVYELKVREQEAQVRRAAKS